MLTRLKSRQQFIIFLSIFFVINLLQGYFTALFEDEAYYWVWSKDMAWGYFDHPPLVALWIKIGTLFFNNELGVRFFSAVSFSLMLIIIWKTISHPKKQNYVWLYFVLVISLVFLNVFGFITTPDTPLMLFIALFLYGYRQFLYQENWFSIFCLAVAMAGMMYSKYHAILVIFFVVLSHLKLLLKPKFWYSALLALILYTPHLYWQYLNDFPSFRYHLSERGRDLYKIGDSLMHLVNQIAIVGITFPLIYKAFWKHKTNDLFYKSLQFIVYGFIIFFLISSFSSRTQAQWTAAILIPLLIISFPYFVDHLKDRQWLIKLAVIQLILMMVIRVFFASSGLSPIVLEPHKSQTWIAPLKDKTNEKPIVFVNSYTSASLYNFYTGIDTHSYSVLVGRKSQYDLAHFEERMQGRDVYAAGTLLTKDSVLVKKGKRDLNGKPISNYHTFQKVTCETTPNIINLKESKTITLAIKLTNVYNKKIDFDHVKFVGVFLGKKNRIVKKVPLKVTGLKPLHPFEGINLQASFQVKELNYDHDLTFRVALDFYDLLEGYQGNIIKVVN